MLLLLACTGADSGAACASDEPAVEIGDTVYDEDGLASWVEMAEGGEAVMVHGPQGGWHVLASARVRNTDPIVSIHYTITASGQTVSDNVYRVQLVAESACQGSYPGMYGYLDVSALAAGEADTPPELLGGASLLLSMEVEDEAGRRAEDQISMIAALDPEDR